MRDRQRILSSILKDKSFSGFEKAVYRAVFGIPKGQTRSYAWVAKTIGCPRASRAVGNALNRNPYPGPIPCHRVIRSDGSMGGYAEGCRKKRRLLKDEGAGIIG
jgi:O-6-methylguanine DNA methyltransferase